MKIEELKAYEIIEKRRIEELKSDGIYLKHKKTGAKVVLLSNQDENKVFYIGFRTTPQESTGVFHILEHSVLCGSKNFPVKDPFIELVKGSLNTFLNAMTYPDKTVYPVASCNAKDFQNLMHVYLDAVFYPNIYNHDMTFCQEGWHYEMEDMDSDLTINGVVYNEMKGAFSSPDDVLEREIFNSLFPDTIYHEESGGDPERIPDLTYEHYIDMHKKYYHPSNSYIYLYGDMDMAEKLQFIDEQYLSAFEPLEIDSAVTLQEPFSEAVDVTKQYSISAGEDKQNKTYLSYNTVIGDNLDRKRYIAFQILDYVLCSAPGAPLKQALLDVGIGQDVYSFYDNGIIQPYFSVVAKNANVDQKAKFLEIIKQTLQTLCKEGLNKKSLEAALNYFEFKSREADFGSYPPGLMYGLQIFDSWLYADNMPFIHIEANDTFAELREKIAGTYFEDLIQEYFLQNTHSSVLVVEPVENLAEEKEKQLAQKLAQKKNNLTEEEKQEIIEKTHALVAYQEEEDDEEALACIPLLTKEDIKKEVEPLVNEERQIGTLPGLYHKIYTNGIAYIRLLFDVTSIQKELFPYLGLLKNVLGLINTKQYQYGELYDEMHLKTGGMSPVLNLYSDVNNRDKIRVSFEWKTKVLEPKMKEGMELIEEILFQSDFTDKKRLLELLQELKSHMQGTLDSAGHQVAAARATSYFSKAAAYSDMLNGLTFYDQVEEWVKNYDSCYETLITNLQNLCKEVFQKQNVLFDFTGSEEAYQEFLGLAEKLSQKLPETTEPTEKYEPILEKKQEALVTAGQVQFVAVAGNFKEAGLEYSGAMRVLRVMMGYDYLWNNIRVKGGAYGCMSSFSRNGDCYFVSYRDPNLEKTIEVYEKAADYVEHFTPDERTMTQYIIGAISDVDTPLTPAAKGLRSLSAYMTCVTEELLQKERNQILSASGESIRELAKQIRSFVSQNNICVVGTNSKVQQAKDKFLTIRNLYS